MRKLLIANRGEIAIRIARTARDRGIATVAIHSDADAGALHPALADEAWSLGPGTAVETYLDIGRILDIAARSGVDAVHPGYGFLSERAEFAEAVIAAGLTWVGPPPAAIRALGDKLAARAIAAEVGAPLVRASDGALPTAAAAVEFARLAGLPLAIKAVHGGGGRGMKVARDLAEVGTLFDSARREAEAAFGRGDCYAERFLERPRHVEAQVIADSHGKVVVLGTRDCTLQRRHQKLVEEAPAPFLPPEIRARIDESARAICAHAGYVGAGTVEYLLSADGILTFLEVNTRLQVEHPVTEETTGLDLVALQLLVAEGAPLPFDRAPEPRGHAIEFRINAEDPGRGFLPTPGRITRFRPPSGPGVRLDSGVEEGGIVPTLYDSLMAKLIVRGASRAEALARATRALGEFAIEGVASTLPFHRAVVGDPAFAAGDGFTVHTGWIETEFAGLPPAPRVEEAQSPLIRGFVEIDGKRHAIALPAGLFGPAAAPASPAPPAADDPAELRAPLPGTLQKWLVADGAEVARGEAVALIEAMKAETRLPAPLAGRLRIRVPAGSRVDQAALLAVIDQSPPPNKENGA